MLEENKQAVELDLDRLGNSRNEVRQIFAQELGGTSECFYNSHDPKQEEAGYKLDDIIELFKGLGDDQVVLVLGVDDNPWMEDILFGYVFDDFRDWIDFFVTWPTLVKVIKVVLKSTIQMYIKK